MHRKYHFPDYDKTYAPEQKGGNPSTGSRLQDCQQTAAKDGIRELANGHMISDPKTSCDQKEDQKKDDVVSGLSQADWWHRFPELRVNEHSWICLICRRSLKRWSTLREHHKIHSMKFPCSYCNKRPFVSEEKKAKHENDQHINPPYPCTYCGRPCTTKTRRERHEITHTGEKPFECYICKTAYSMKAVATKCKKQCSLKKVQVGNPGGNE